MYSEKTISIAKSLQKSAKDREELIKAIQSLGDEVKYSGQAFDRLQELASDLEALAQ